MCKRIRSPVHPKGTLRNIQLPSNRLINQMDLAVPTQQQLPSNTQSIQMNLTALPPTSRGENTSQEERGLEKKRKLIGGQHRTPPWKRMIPCTWIQALLDTWQTEAVPVKEKDWQKNRSWTETRLHLTNVIFSAHNKAFSKLMPILVF